MISRPKSAHISLLGGTFVGALLFLVLKPGLGGAQNSHPLATDSAVHVGRHIFLTRCASCHGTDANGGEFGPSILDRVRFRSDTCVADVDIVIPCREISPGAGAHGRVAVPSCVARKRVIT